jgi:hypothetical protein
MRRTPHDRGTVLLLAMLVILVLAAVSMVAVQAAVNTMNRTGSFRVGMVAYDVTQAGSEATMALAASNPEAFNQFLEAKSFRVRMSDVSPTFFDLTPADSTHSGGSFGREFGAVGGVDWETSLFNSGLSHRVPGFSSGEFCFRKYLATTDGYYGNQAVVNADDVLRNSQKRFMASIFVGPVECP